MCWHRTLQAHYQSQLPNKKTWNLSKWPHKQKKKTTKIKTFCKSESYGKQQTRNQVTESWSAAVTVKTPQAAWAPSHPIFLPSNHTSSNSPSSLPFLSSLSLSLLSVFSKRSPSFYSLLLVGVVSALSSVTNCKKLEILSHEHVKLSTNYRHLTCVYTGIQMY